MDNGSGTRSSFLAVLGDEANTKVENCDGQESAYTALKPKCLLCAYSWPQVVATAVSVTKIDSNNLYWNLTGAADTLLHIVKDIDIYIYIYICIYTYNSSYFIHERAPIAAYWDPSMQTPSH